ncbi:Na+/H+ antiporter NhaC family protein [Mechercharimyces sp. CAU 1602]|uniref:Na+/H+ antiporter NhaC family protein n=1 Tax=Mechercharimyces sp. CAU 1602 TaxID=2973933 RepID=UPI0021636651|nr:Na+/H+ antiporter NhaC family protein [Mechercharimyces sp. CAU 1602]MCS1351864.1 Na+/H+ antiporter NhaC family protein [Mechercharimyces sp. CAU 1602]
MESSFLSLLPPIITLLLVFLTRRVLLSLGAGIVLGAFLLNDWNIGASLYLMWEVFISIIWDLENGGLNTWNMYIIFFVLLMGILSAWITLSGGGEAFARWALKKANTRTKTQLVPYFLGILIFFDDYFNTLIVGNVSRQITDRQRISRAKLAYLIDSTSAPVVVMMPLSSWGAYIIALIAGILGSTQITQYSGLEAFLFAIPANYYAITALLLLLAVILFQLDIGPMRKHERRAQEEGVLVDPNSGDVPGHESVLPSSETGKISNLLLPLIGLIIGTIISMAWTGIQAIEGEVTLLTILEFTDVSASLFYGAIVGVVVALFANLRQKTSGSWLFKGAWAGIRSMLPAIYILFLAWMITDIISKLETGDYLASWIDPSLSLFWLPAILFLFASIMAFATGTSWGTFGIMLPIAGEIVAATDPLYIIPAIGAVLGGSVLGDHCSPISDTTIMSSTGAGCVHIDHVTTQLPYALLSGIVATIGYLILGITNSVLLGLLSTFAGLAILVAILRVWNQKQSPLAKS